jgi:hypothetical protein
MPPSTSEAATSPATPKSPHTTTTTQRPARFRRQPGQFVTRKAAAVLTAAAGRNESNNSGSRRSAARQGSAYCTTNEGDTAQGRVIYSVQASHRVATSGQEAYCNGPPRFGDYKSCMFSTVEACYNTKLISAAPAYRRVDWSDHFGYLSHMSDVARRHPGKVEGRRQIAVFCDPGTPGSGRD